MSRIYWDSMLFIYWIHDHPAYAPRILDILSKMNQRGDVLCTGTLTLGEVLTGAVRWNDARLAGLIRDRLSAPAVELLEFSAEAAEKYAVIRASLRISPPDAIHLACAAEAGTDVFLTNDRSLVGKSIPGIGFVAGMETDYFG